jgi:P-type Cu+ transporter
MRHDGQSQSRRRFTVYDGATYYFYSDHCVAKFKAHPERFLKPAKASASAAKPVENGVKHTCPMHPEIVRDGPGACPKCGMALEPVQPTAEAGPDPELIAMQQRFWVATALTIPIFLIAMAGLIPSKALMALLHSNMSILNWTQLLQFGT